MYKWELGVAAQESATESTPQGLMAQSTKDSLKKVLVTVGGFQKGQPLDENVKALWRLLGKQRKDSALKGNAATKVVVASFFPPKKNRRQS